MEITIQVGVCLRQVFEIALLLIIKIEKKTTR